MNFREHFETWHKAKYGYVTLGSGTAMDFTYPSSVVQARWEAWQAWADWHSEQQMGVNSTHTLDNDELVDKGKGIVLHDRLLNGRL